MTRYAEDTFTRTVASTWGVADLGGTWQHSQSGTVTLSVDGTRARCTWAAGSGGTGTALLSVAQTALEAHGAIQLRFNDPAFVGSAVYWFRAAGSSASHSGYGVRVGRNGNTGNNLIAEIVRGPSDASTVIATLAPPAAWPVYTGYFVAELEVLGTNPTTIKARWWPGGSPPADDSGWTTVTDTVGPQAAGVVGVRMSRTNTIVTELLVDILWMTDPLRVNFTATPAGTGLTQVFNSSLLSTGDPASWDWDWGDGTAHGTTADATHVYATEAAYSVTLTLTTKWGTKRSATQTVVAALLPIPPVGPTIYINGEDVCDRVYSLSWQVGRDRWPDETNGSSVTLQLRGRMPDLVMGAKVVIALPPGAPPGTITLWSGEVDTVTEGVEPIEAKTTTTIVAMDVMAFLGRYHILPATTMVEGGLPTRVLSLSPRGTTVYRQKWAGVAGSRWPTLKSLSAVPDKLRSKTYLDILRDGLRASLATAYVAPDGAIVYAPMDPPSGLTPPILDLDASGPDCPQHVDIDKSTAEGMVNRWTVGDTSSTSSAPAVDRVERPSIEAYGESVWSVGAGILKVDSSFPITDPIAVSLREPFANRVVTIPIRDWSAKSFLMQPLDMAAMDGILYGILGVKQRYDLSGWLVDLTLGRDPWTLTGSTPPITPPAVHTSTQTFLCSKDALLASPDMGAGKATRLPVGLYGGVKYRALVQFDLDWAHTPKRVVQADLLLDTAGQDAVSYGSSPAIQIDRVTGSWSEGTYGGDGPPWHYSESNAVVYPGPSVTSSGRQTANIPSSENNAVTIAMTLITRAWADGSSNRGIRIISTNEASTSKTTEFYSSEYGGATSRRPQLRVTYEW